MLAKSRVFTARFVRAAIFLIVAMLVVVPALVRAGTAQSITSGLRLNRGFDAPPSKWCVSPPSRTPVAWETRSLLQPEFRAASVLVVLDETLPRYVAFRSLDPLRGPPPALLA